MNGDPVAGAHEPGTYAAVRRTWTEGDVIELDLPMPVRLVQANPRAEQLRGQVAVFRGPLLYCLESPDVADDVELSSVHMPADAALDPVPADDVAPGLIALEGGALYRAEPAWDSLYRPLPDCPLQPMPVRMIPYFAWANRGPAAMTVWLPVVLR